MSNLRAEDLDNELDFRSMNKRIVVNTGPIIAFGKIGVFDLIRQLPFDFITPIQVQTEITIGSGLGYSVEVPS